MSTTSPPRAGEGVRPRASRRCRWACRWECRWHGTCQTVWQPLYKHAPNPRLSGSTPVISPENTHALRSLPQQCARSFICISPTLETTGRPVFFRLLPRRPLIKLLVWDSASTSAATAISDPTCLSLKRSMCPGSRAGAVSASGPAVGEGFVSSRTMSKAEPWWVPEENEARWAEPPLAAGGWGQRWWGQDEDAHPQDRASIGHLPRGLAITSSLGVRILTPALCRRPHSNLLPCLGQLVLHARLPGRQQAFSQQSSQTQTPAIHSSQFSPHLLLGDPAPDLFQFSL